MSLAGELRRRLSMLLHRGRFQRELDEEMRLHLELRRQQQIASGLDPEAARWSAQRRFGNVTRIKEKSHMAWGWNWLETFLQDAGYGLRSMLRTPAITVVALISLALGIGANTAIFSFLDAMMLRSLPVKNPQQLVKLGVEDPERYHRHFRVHRALFLSLLPPVPAEERRVHRHSRHPQPDERRSRFCGQPPGVGADPRSDRLRHILSNPRRRRPDGPCAQRRR